jgi:hypothetical protein
MKFKPTTVRAGVVLTVGLLIVGFTVWKTFPRKQKLSLNDYAKAQYMHCPECNHESRFDPDGVDKACLQCGYEDGHVPTEKSLKETATKSPYGKLVSFVLPELVALMTALWLVLRPREDSAGEGFRYLRCANCGQKLRYREAQIGSLGACSRCKRAFRFPEGTSREKDLDSGKAEEQVDEEAEE